MRTHTSTLELNLFLAGFPDVGFTPWGSGANLCVEGEYDRHVNHTGVSTVDNGPSAPDAWNGSVVQPSPCLGEMFRDGEICIIYRAAPDGHIEEGRL